jgi:transcription initiation factor TFIID TATA-box-binding protein
VFLVKKGVRVVVRYGHMSGGKDMDINRTNSDPKQHHTFRINHMPKVKTNKKKKKRIDTTQLTFDKNNVRPLPPFHLQNVVATFNLGVDHLNLRAIALEKPFVEYNPQKFAAASMRIRSPRTTALAFASGNMVCTGAKTELESRFASRKYVRILQKHGIPVAFRDFKIQNIVASAEIPHALKLVELSMAYGPYVSYEPDLFPGLVFRTTLPKLVFLIFRSGKVVITGAKCREEIQKTWSMLFYGVVQKFIDYEDTSSSSSDYRTRMRRKIHSK